MLVAMDTIFKNVSYLTSLHLLWTLFLTFLDKVKAEVEQSREQSGSCWWVVWTVNSFLFASGTFFFLAGEDLHSAQLYWELLFFFFRPKSLLGVVVWRWDGEGQLVWIHSSFPSFPSLFLCRVLRDSAPRVVRFHTSSVTSRLLHEAKTRLCLSCVCHQTWTHHRQAKLILYQYICSLIVILLPKSRFSASYLVLSVLV